MKDLLPPAFAREHRVAPLGQEGGTLVVGALPGAERSAERWVRLHWSGPLRVVPLEARALEAAIADLEGGFGAQRASGDPTRRLIDSLLAAAVRVRASDIHFEPGETGLSVRWRVDGVLRETDLLPPGERATILTRLMVLAGMDIAARRRVQDGRARVEVDGRPIDLRVSSVPTRHGESVVVRLLPVEAGFRSPADLGAVGPLEPLFRRAIGGVDRMVLFTGPTGSGKSTSIDLALESTRRPEQKIVSIEDPVERVRDDRTQIGVRLDLGFDFPRALRHVLRHDPDVLVVGEIRDRETAEVAFQAALSGHRVLSTLHATSALAAVGRLLGLGVTPGLVAAGLAAVVAQRLVRRSCPACRARGCPDCGLEGYAGRTGVFEVFLVDAEARRAIRSGANAAELRAIALANGWRPMIEDGLAKVAAGVTTRIELHRATGRIECRPRRSASATTCSRRPSRRAPRTSTSSPVRDRSSRGSAGTGCSSSC